MKTKSIILIILSSFIFAGIAFGSKSELTGAWVDSHQNYYEFIRDGRFNGYNMVGKKKIIGLSGKYKIKDNKIIITITKSDSDKVNVGNTETTYYFIKDNQLNYTDNKGNVINKLTRVK